MAGKACSKAGYAIGSCGGIGGKRICLEDFTNAVFLQPTDLCLLQGHPHAGVKTAILHLPLLAIAV